MVSLTYGIMIGWVAPMQPVLQANYTGTNNSSPLGDTSPPLTNEDISWLGGFICVGGMVGTILYGYLASVLGRKLAIILAGVPFIVAYCLVLMATNTYYLFAARFIAGLGGAGACVIAPMYIGETAQDSIRGALGSYFNLFICSGILFSYIVGSYTSYNALAIASIVFPVIFLVISAWLPESPTYLLINNKMEAAKKSMYKLRGNHEFIETEMSNLVQSIREMNDGEEETITLKDIISDIGTRKGLIIGTTVMMVQQFSGISPIIAYAVDIFKASGSNIQPNLATIIVGSLQLVGAVIGTVYMDRSGRKFLLMVSSIGMSLTLAPIAAFFYWKEQGADEEFMKSIGWVPVTAMSIYVIVFGLGFGPVPFVLVGEIFEAKAKGLATSICVLYVWFLAFLLLKFYPNVSEWFGNGVCFGLFSFCCMLGAIFTYYCIPETKGKSLDMILSELRGQKRKYSQGVFSVPLMPLTDSNKAQIIQYNFQGDSEKTETQSNK